MNKLFIFNKIRYNLVIFIAILINRCIMQKTGDYAISASNLRGSHYLQYLFGVICKILSLSCFCIISLVFEHSTKNAPSSLAQYGIVCTIGALTLLPIILIFFRKELLASNIKLYPIRAIFSLVATLCWLEAIKMMGSTKTMLATYLGPILVIAIASIMGIERIQKKCLFMSFLCYLIIIFALNIDSGINNNGLLLAIISAVFWALYEITCKQQAPTEHYLIQVFYTMLFTAVLLLPFFYVDCFNITATALPKYFMVALLRIANCAFLFLAIKYASLNWVVPVSYTKFAIMVFWAYLLNGTTVEPKYYIACFFLILLNIIIMQYRRKQEFI